jgi:hypothetical protein
MYLFKFLGGLIMDDRNGTPVISLGRVALIAVLVQLFIFWHKEVPILPAGIMEVFYALTGYVFGSKAVGMVKDWIGNGKTSEAPEVPPKP